MHSPRTEIDDARLPAVGHAARTAPARQPVRSVQDPLPPIPRRVRSTDLLDGAREVEIEHAGAVYRLRRTALGKLILTK